MSNSVSLIIPTYKERDNITRLVERVHGALASRPYRLLIVDDDSKDGTAELVDDLSKKYPLDLMVRKGKKGLASAVVDGIASTKGNVLLVMDADLQHPPEVIPDLLKAIDGGADVAVASRYVKGGGCEGWSLTRRIISKVAVLISHILLPRTMSIKDPMSGFFAFTRPVTTGVTLNPTGYKILLEILVQGKANKTTEVPYTFYTRTRGESKLKMRTQVEYLKHILSLMVRSGELTRLGKFLLVGLSGVGVNEGLLWILREFARFPLAVSSAIAVEASIISNFALNNIFTFGDRRSSSAGLTLRRFVKFNLVSLAGLGINIGVLWMFTHVFGVHYLISNLIGIAVAALWNYFLSTLWTWK